jgi:hypothetical protein
MSADATVINHRPDMPGRTTDPNGQNYATFGHALV